MGYLVLLVCLCWVCGCVGFMLVCLFWCYRFCAVVLCAMTFWLGFYIGYFVFGFSLVRRCFRVWLCVGVAMDSVLCFNSVVVTLLFVCWCVYIFRFSGVVWLITCCGSFSACWCGCGLVVFV